MYKPILDSGIHVMEDEHKRPKALGIRYSDDSHEIIKLWRVRMVNLRVYDCWDHEVIRYVLATDAGRAANQAMIVCKGEGVLSPQHYVTWNADDVFVKVEPVPVMMQGWSGNHF